jgi:hypothetical protein
VNSTGNGVYQTGTTDPTLNTSTPAPAIQSPAPVQTSVNPTATVAPAQPLPTNTNSSSNYLASLQSGLQQAQSAASPNANYVSSLQQAISAEQARQAPIVSGAQSLVSGGAGSADIQNYYSTLHPNDQSLVGDTLGLTANNVNNQGLTPQSSTWYQLQPNETIANYNARIASANPNLPAPGTTSSTGVTNTATAATQPLSSANLGSTSNLNFGTPADTSSNTIGANASAAATQASIQQQQAAYAETPAQQQESSISQLLQGLNTQEAGKAGAQATANTNAGVDTAQATVNDLQSKLSTLTNEAAAIKMTPQPNEGVTTAIDTRQRDGALATNAIAALAVSSLLNAANSSLATAQAQANKAVALIFDPIEAQIAADTANLKLIQNDPNTTLQEQQQAQAQLDIKNAQADAVAAQKQNLADVLSFANTAASNYAANPQNFTATAQYPNASVALTAMQQSHSVADAAMIAASTGLGGSTADNTLLTPTEAKTLGVPYGTTRAQAAGQDITPPATTPSSTTPKSGVITDGKLVVTPTEISQGANALHVSASSGAEADGKYADPTLYLQMYQHWIASGGTSKGFLAQYPYSKYINPANTWLSQALTDSNKTTTSSNSTSINAAIDAAFN